MVPVSIVQRIVQGGVTANTGRTTAAVVNSLPKAWIITSNTGIGMFTGAHLHLLVNHAPIFGSVFACLLLIASYFVAPDIMRRTALIILIVTAIAGVLADKTGEPAEDA